MKLQPRAHRAPLPWTNRLTEDWTQVGVDLRSSVRQGPNLVCGSWHSIAELNGGPKVTELDRGRPLKQKIFRLDVSVHDALRVQVIDRIQHLPEEVPRHALAQAAYVLGPVSEDVLEEVAALTELQDDVQRGTLDESLQHLHHVRVLQLCEDQALRLETC